jgi:hypothetical protein
MAKIVRHYKELGHIKGQFFGKWLLYLFSEFGEFGEFNFLTPTGKRGLSFCIGRGKITQITP